MGSGSIFPRRILGPGRSAIMATRRPTSLATFLIRRITWPWPEKSPWEKFNGAPLTPAQIRRFNIWGDSEAGPIVAPIFVLWSGRLDFMGRMVAVSLAGPLPEEMVWQQQTR